MKTLRELKYDLLFEQNLYRKYLDDYKKIEDGEEIVKAIETSGVKRFKDMKTGKEYVIRKSGARFGYKKNEQGQIEVDKDAFSQGSTGPDGKTYDKDTEDAGGQAQQEPTKEPQPDQQPPEEPRPGQPPPKEPKPDQQPPPEKDVAQEPKDEPGKEPKDTKTEPEPEEAPEVTQNRDADNKKADNALEGKTTEAGIGAGVLTSQAGETLTHKALRMMKEGSTLEEIESYMNEKVSQEGHPLNSKTGKEWVGAGIACATLVSDKYGIDNIEEIVWDTDEGRALIGTEGHGTSADIFVKLKDGTRVGISLKKSPKVFIHNGGFDKAMKSMATGMRDRGVPEEIVKRFEEETSATHHKEDLIKTYTDKDRQKKFLKVAGETITNIQKDGDLAKEILGKNWNDPQGTKKDKLSYVELVPVVFKKLSEGKKLSGNEIKVLARIAKYHQNDSDMHKELRSADYRLTKRMLETFEKDPEIESVMKDEVLNGIHIESILGTRHTGNLDSFITAYGVEPDGAELSKEKLTKMFGEKSERLLNEDIVEFHNITDPKLKRKKRTELLDELKSHIKVDYEDGAKDGIIKIVQEYQDEDGKTQTTEYPLFSLANRARGIGNAPVFEMYQTPFLANSLMHGLDVNKWPEPQRGKWFDDEIKSAKDDLKDADGDTEMEAAIKEKIQKLQKEKMNEETMYTFAEFLAEEEVELDEKRKPLTLAQRNKKKMSFRRSKMKRKISMERNKKKLATKEKLQTRTDKKARMRVIGKLFPALANKPRSEWSNSDKKRAEQIIIDNQSKIKKFAKIMYKDVRKAEVARLAKYRENRAKIT